MAYAYPQLRPVKTLRAGSDSMPDTRAATEEDDNEEVSAFRFLDLPPGLRNKMYEHALSDKVIHVHSLESEDEYESSFPVVRSCVCIATDSDDHVASRLQNAVDDTDEFDFYGTRHKVCKIKGPRGSSYPIALLRTCRQIYHETKHMPPEKNTFSFQEDRDMDHFIDNLECNSRAESICSIRSVILGESVNLHDQAIFASGGLFKNHNLHELTVFKSTPRLFEDVGFALWQMTGKDVDEYLERQPGFNGWNDFCKGPAFEHKVTKIDKVSIYVHHISGSKQQAIDLNQPAPNHTGLRDFCRMAEAEAMSGGEG